MLLNSKQGKVLKPFVDETLNALQKVLGLSAIADNGFQDKVDEFHFKGYAVVMNTQGSVEGRILIHHYTETAIEIGNRILAKKHPGMEKSGSMDDNISNALAEFAYQIMEPAVKTLHASKIDIQFSQAYFVSDMEKMSNMLQDVAEIITVPIRIGQVGRFYLNYLLHEKM